MNARWYDSDVDSATTVDIEEENFMPPLPLKLSLSHREEHRFPPSASLYLNRAYSDMVIEEEEEKISEIKTNKMAFEEEEEEEEKMNQGI